MVMQLTSRSMPPRHRAPVDSGGAAIYGDAIFGEAGRGSSGVAIPNVVAICKRRWKLIAATAGGGLLLAVAYIVLATPLFTSTASILIDTRMNQTLQKQNIIDDTPVDTSGVDSQVNVILSDSIAQAVIRKLQLTQDPEFIGPPDALGAQIMFQISGGIAKVMSWLGRNDVPVVDAATLLEQQALQMFEKRLTVKREELSYLIDISYASESPTKAARITNAIVDAYMAADLDAKIQSTKSANQWLQQRLLELKTEATDADHQLQLYKATNNIVETGRGLLDQQTLSDLNTQMIAARAAVAEAKARLDRIKQIDGDAIPDATVTDALNNPVITRLRAQYLDLSSREADLIKSVGSQHIATVKLQDQMNQLKLSILSEEQRIADAYASDYAIANARLASLAASMQQMVGLSETTSQAQVKARDLESSADASRNIYNSFLQKFQETEQAQTIPVSDSRLVSVGEVPLKKSSPKSLLALVGGVMLGLLSGAGVAVSKEIMSDVLRSGLEVEQGLGVTCLGILPDLRRSMRTKTGTHVVDALEWVRKAPHSRFTETIRNVYVSLRQPSFDHVDQVIGVVSSLPREGKTTVAANLAVLSASLGKRTLLIDGDMHERSLTKALAPTATLGLLEAIAEPGRLASCIAREARAAVDVLPCVTAERPVNAADLLASPQMAELLNIARGHYDSIVIEFAPILSVVDVRAAGHLIDRFVLVVEWGKTRQKLVSEVLSDNETVRDRVAGIVLNKADPVTLKSIESNRGPDFAAYYQD